MPMKQFLTLVVTVAALGLTACSGGAEETPSAPVATTDPSQPVTPPYTPQEVATLIGATDVQDAADIPSQGDEVSVDWRGHQLNIWVPRGSSTLAEGSVLATGPSSLGDGWLITARSQFIADAANDMAYAVLIADSQH